MKQPTISYKNFLINFLIFILFMSVIFLVLIYSIKVSQKCWNKNLEPAIQAVLDEKDPDTWVIEAVTINPIANPFTTSAACYDIRNKKNGEYYKGIIIRIQTFYGPFPAVFIMDKNKKVEYKGYASLHGRVAHQLASISHSRRINYWLERIPQIIE